MYAPGENGDEINVLFSDVNVLAVGDNIYSAFPDVYAPRGVRDRPSLTWIASIDQVRDLHVNALALSHTLPIIGASNVATSLQVYRDILQFVHDQTVAALTAGATPDLIATTLTLPPALTNPAEFYGTLDSSVRAVTKYYLGEWDGRMSTLLPQNPVTRSTYLVEALGGPFLANLRASALLQADSLDATLFALEIIEAVLTASGVSSNDLAAATQVAIDATQNLGYAQVSANERNIYLSFANKLQGNSQFALPPSASAAAILGNPISATFLFLQTKLNLAALATLPPTLVPEFAVLIEFVDAGVWTARIRQASQVAEIRQPSVLVGPFQLTIQTSSLVFKACLLQPTSIPTLLAAGELVVSSVPLFELFLELFA